MVTIIYANRNRDVKRIKASLDSLQRQTEEDFEVVFVDYGSVAVLVEEYRELLASYNFSRFFPLEVSHLLWNKSKALNYGIKKAASPFIFIADVDLIFHPKSVSLFKKHANPENFFVFPLSYLERDESQKLKKKYIFSDLKPSRSGEVNGMLLASRRALLSVNGLDEFFHFYGAEDEDLFGRLENAGYKKEEVKECYFLHNWHKSFSGSEDKLLTGNPRVKNIMRINQRHFLQNRKMKITRPIRQKGMAELVDGHKEHLLKNPDLLFEVANILAHVEHFLGEELPYHKGKMIKAVFYEDPYYNSLKYWLKKKVGRQTQPYISMKQVNDMLLKEILFRYRDNNYNFNISKDLKSINFSIKL